MKLRFLMWGAAVALLLGGIFLGWKQLTTHVEPAVHYHAGFVVYVDGVKQDFSSSKYMHEEKCTLDPQPPEDDQIEKAHLHDGVGDVVHVHRDGAVWGDLFQNIGFTIDPQKTIAAYVNGEQVEDILNYPIKAYDSLVLVIGKADNLSEMLSSQVTKDHIVGEEAKSESCGSS